MRGVTPDISLPMMSDKEDFGESSYDNALPWSQIKAADYIPAGDLKGILPMLTTSHDIRVAHEKDYQYLRQDVAEFEAQRKKNQISLNFAVRSKEREEQEAKLKLRETVDKASGKAFNDVLEDDGLQSNERNLNTDLAREKARKDAKDVLLNESAHILTDEVDMLQNNASLAAIVLPKVTVH